MITLFLSQGDFCATAVQGFPALPYVSPELDTVRRLYSSEVLLNQQFRIPSVEKELQDKPFNVVHIASHGEFDSDAKKTFLLAFDEKLTLDRLDQAIGRLRFREDALELLTLSACQTAAGDDRAALGLAGVAIKAGAGSVLATLKYVFWWESAHLTYRRQPGFLICVPLSQPPFPMPSPRGTPVSHTLPPRRRVSGPPGTALHLVPPRTGGAAARRGGRSKRCGKGVAAGG